MPKNQGLSTKESEPKQVDEYVRVMKHPLKDAKGGCGPSSSANCTVRASLAPHNSAITAIAKSIPAVTPDLVIRFRSITTRWSTAMAPSNDKSSIAIQCVVARYPRNNPAAASSSDPVQTDVVKRA